MAITVVLKCSECSTIREAGLKADEKEISCPACGRRMQNLTEAEHAQIEAVQKKQRLYCIISLVLFALAIACLVYWTGGKWVSDGKQPEANQGLFIGAAVLGLGSLVCGWIASVKRYVVEF
jgi:DNA-directed RNA polymerase subunit RPC12/RpoP